jgi:indole-3-glycerol phosphate synthase
MSVLAEIFAAKRDRVRALGSSGLAEARVRALDGDAVRGFERALEESEHRPSLIAEVKRKSPSQGVIRADFDAVELARVYSEVGVDCLSVLTDEEWFGGSKLDFESVRKAVAQPMIRKDFVAGEVDVYESRAIGADAILLIVAGLDQSELTDYQALAWSLGMDVLVETHTAAEVEIAVKVGAKIIGVNNRNLHDFEEKISTTDEMLPLIPEDRLIVSESSLKSADDVRRVSDSGARSVLIGTAFCREADAAGAVRRIMGWV